MKYLSEYKFRLEIVLVYLLSLRVRRVKKPKKLEIMDPPSHNDLKNFYKSYIIRFGIKHWLYNFFHKRSEKCGIRTGSENWKTDAFNHFTDNISLFATNSIRIIIYENSRLWPPIQVQRLKYTSLFNLPIFKLIRALFAY